MGVLVVGAYFLQGKYPPITLLLHQWRSRAGELFHQNIINRKNRIDVKDSIGKVNEWIEMNRNDGSSSDIRGNPVGFTSCPRVMVNLLAKL